MAAVNHKDTYKASAVFLIVMGMLYLIDKFIGLPHTGCHGLCRKTICYCMQLLFSFGSRPISQ